MSPISGTESQTEDLFTLEQARWSEHASIQGIAVAEHKAKKSPTRLPPNGIWHTDNVWRVFFFTRRPFLFPNSP